jgi:hypothetical protein
VQKVAPEKESERVKGNFPDIHPWHHDIILSHQHATSSSWPAAPTRFSVPRPDSWLQATFLWCHWISSHRPLFPAGRLVILWTRWYYPDKNVQFPTQFSSSLYTICKPATAHTRFSGERIWLSILGQCPSFVEGRGCSTNTAESSTWKMRQAAPRSVWSLGIVHIFQRPCLHLSKFKYG